MRVPSANQWKSVLPLIMLVLIFTSKELYASGPAGGDSKVVVKDGMMSIAADDYPLGILLEDIERQSGVRFKVSRSLREDSVSLGFQGVPFVEALKKILIRKSYLMLFDRSGKLSEVVVIQKREGYKPPTTPYRPRFRSQTSIRNTRFNRSNRRSQPR